MIQRRDLVVTTSSNDVFKFHPLKVHRKDLFHLKDSIEIRRYEFINGVKWFVFHISIHGISQTSRSLDS